MADFSTDMASALAALDTQNGQLGVGAKFKIYSGTKPADAREALTSQVLLWEGNCANPAYAAAYDDGADHASADLNAIPETAPVAAGVATFWRTETSGGVAKQQGDCSAPGGGGDLVINPINLDPGVPLEIQSMTIKQKIKP